MQRILVLICATAMALFAGSCSIRNRPTLIPDRPDTITESIQPLVQTDYYMQVSDQLSVYFPSTPAFNFQAKVRPDGRVTSPLYGDVVAEGKTPQGLADELKALYAKELNDPRVVVSVTEFGPQPIYVLGEVKSPNRYVWERGLDLIQAVGMTGGTLRTANLKDVIVMRVAGDGSYSYTAYNMQSLQGGRQMPVLLHPRDIVIVPTSTIADIGIWLEQYVNIWIPPLDLFLTGRYHWFLAKNAADQINN